MGGAAEGRASRTRVSILRPRASSHGGLLHVAAGTHRHLGHLHGPPGATRAPARPLLVLGVRHAREAGKDMFRRLVDLATRMLLLLHLVLHLVLHLLLHLMLLHLMLLQLLLLLHLLLLLLLLLLNFLYSLAWEWGFGWRRIGLRRTWR